VDVRVDSERLIDTLGPWTWLAAGRRIAAWQPDLVVFKYWMPFFAPAYGSILRVLKRKNVRTCFLLDNVLPHERRWFDLPLTRYVLGPVDAFIAQSEAVARDLEQFRPGTPCLRVPHPLYDLFGEKRDREAARRRLGVTARDVALFFGFIRPYKGLRDLLEAIARVPRTRDLQLLVGGEVYGDAAPYHEAARSLGIEDRVVWHLRYVPNDEVADFMSAANVLVLPYTSATQSGIAQIAMSFDLPSIATDVGGLPETVRDGETGDIVPPGNPDALAQALDTYFERGHEAIYAPQVAEEKVRYSWGALVDALERLVVEAGDRPAS
ncbi:MAG TPA: glycosyltransferase, partial [Candidatus Eisenbacteria bacterium]|nr:glycosyltransferase [Candidatus Eisenbacteria bacterium]